MRRLLVFVCLALGLVLPAAPAHAETIVQKNIPIDYVADVCGETIALSGTSLLLFTVQPLGDGGVLYSFHYQQQGVTGTSSSGATYRGTGVTGNTTVVAPGGGYTFTDVMRFSIVGTTGAPTYSLTQMTHITITATGELSAYVDHFSAECV